MKYILSISVFFMLFASKGLAQGDINAYKYIIVPTIYNFLNGPDQYQLNSLTKFLFEKHGITTFMADEEFPQELNSNRCLALQADVEKHKGFLITKLQVHLRDCNNKLVLSSEIGQSREKEFEKVYNLALRDAFKSLDNLDYTYTPIVGAQSQSANVASAVEETSATQQEIERLRKEVEALKEVQSQRVETPQLPVAEVAIPVSENDEEILQTGQTLQANPAENGYTITSGSRLLYHLVFSGKEDVYIVKGQDAIVYKMNNAWMIATATDSGVSMKMLNVKFD